MLLGPGQKLVCIGDSITDAGRRGAAAPHGSGYVSMVRSMLLARYPELGLRVVNKGVSGDTTRQLAARWDRDVIAERPDWISVKIGINDVWRSFGATPHEAVPIDEYEETLRWLLSRTLAATRARIILMEPYIIELDWARPMRNQMDLYGAVVRRLAAEFSAVLVRTQAAFDLVLEHTRPDDWSDDKIHPNEPGHAVIAQAFLRAIGFEL